MTGTETGMERQALTGREACIVPMKSDEYQQNDTLETMKAKAWEDIRRAARSVRELAGCRLRMKMSANRTNNIANELEDLGRALYVKRNFHRK